MREFFQLNDGFPLYHHAYVLIEQQDTQETRITGDTWFWSTLLSVNMSEYD